MYKFFRKIIILLFSSWTICFAQVDLPTPEVQSMMKFGNNDVSPYTGGVNISIPIYTIHSFVKLPIAIKYTGGHGIRVREHASRVGLGWTLVANHSVSRIIKGKADEGPGNNDSFHTSEYIDWKSSLINENKLESTDQEPDLYYYSTPKSSGSFYLDKDLRVVKDIVSKTQIKGRFRYTEGNFEITETDGNKYFFSETELNQNDTYYPVSELGRPYASSSMLTKILSASSNEKIEFFYKEGTETYYNYDNTGQPIREPGGCLYTYPKSKTTATTQLLEYIIWSEGSIRFIYDDDRKDLLGGKALKEILVKNKKGIPLKRVLFEYSYFGSNGVVPYTVTSYHAEGEDKGAELRLKLDKVKFMDKSNSQVFAYCLAYEESVFLPERSSKSIDHWGYYNGRSNKTLNPITNIDANGRKLPGEPANRNSNRQTAKAGVLNCIYYPTGGKTEFDFESNEIQKVPNGFFSGTKETVKRTSTNRKLNELTESWESYVNGNRVIGSLDIRHIKTRKGEGAIEIRTQNYKADIDAIFVNFINLQTNESRTWAIRDQHSLYLKPGLYKVTAHSNYKQKRTFDELGNLSWERWDLSFKWTDSIEEDPNNPNVSVGGLRIAQIRNYDKTGNFTVKSYNYNVEGISSGAITQKPKYVYLKTYNDMSDILGPDLFFSNNPIYPLRLTHNSCTGYAFVEEKQLGKGKTEYNFTTASHCADSYNSKRKTYPNQTSVNVDGYGVLDIFPLPELISSDYARGKLLELKKFSQSPNGSYSLLSHEKNSYIAGGAIDKLHMNIKVFNLDTVFPGEVKKVKAQKIQVLRSCKQDFGTLPEKYSGIEYFLGSKLILLDATITTTYLKNGEVSKNNKKYYNNIAQLVSNKTWDQKYINNVIYKYPSITTIPDLVKRNMIDSPYESIEFSNNKPKGAWKIEYKKEGEYVLPDIKKVAEINKGGGLTYRKDLEFSQYNEEGKLIEYKDRSGLIHSIHWGNSKQYPCAKIQNMEYSQLEPVKALLNTLEDYTDLSSSSKRNEVKAKHAAIRTSIRGIKADALVYTYTYDSLIGMTSKCDPRGRCTFYTYDSFGRLKQVLDHDGKVLKEYDYKYANASK